MEDQLLTVPITIDLLLVARTKAYVELVLNNTGYRDSSLVPDYSRKIFDTNAKVTALVFLLY